MTVGSTWTDISAICTRFPNRQNNNLFENREKRSATKRFEHKMRSMENCWQSQLWLTDWAQLHARIQLSVMSHCLSELILRRISKNWTNLSYFFGWFIILNVMSDLAANFGTLRSRNESEQCTHPTLRHGSLFGWADSETNFEKLDKLVLLLWMIYYSKCYEWSCCKFAHSTIKKWIRAVHASNSPLWRIV